ncbi:anti-sigma factor VreR [Pigmentiphaga soli]|uniref:Anti-sigma factor VreR n=1 Tax=Pigmentiphaga soli TaxID=1007095 RepID=A0ABP8HIA7_9BURK
MPTPSDRYGDAERPDALRQDAHAWLVRMTSGRATRQDAQAFRRWRDASPRHQAAFEEARAQWRLLGPAVGNLLRSDARAAACHRDAMRPRHGGRRAFLGAATGAAAAAAAVAYPPFRLWPAPGEWDADYRTATGEQRSLALAGRVNLVLNTRTSVRRVMRGEELVGLDLLAGETAVDLRQAGEAFGIAAGAGRSVAESGRFEVRYLDGKVCVTCIDGSVRVEHPGGRRQLQSGQQTVYDARTVGGTARVDTAEVSAWRRGELVFKRTPLWAVIDEINRYRPGRVLLMASSLRADTVTAHFRLDALDTALLQIRHTFDLTAQALPGGVLVLS